MIKQIYDVGLLVYLLGVGAYMLYCRHKMKVESARINAEYKQKLEELEAKFN